MSKVFVFSIILFGFCLNSIQASITCLSNDSPDAKPVEKTGCNYCGYNHIHAADNITGCDMPQGTLYYCLSTNTISYGTPNNGGKYSTTSTACIQNYPWVNTCLQMDLSICGTNKCNAQCGPDPNAQKPTTRAPNNDDNGINPTTLSIFCLILSIFVALWTH